MNTMASAHRPAKTTMTPARLMAFWVTGKTSMRADGDGAALLLATCQRLQADGAGADADADAVRVVTAHADEAKAGMLGRLKLGPVLLLDHLSDDADVTAVEREAAMMGAVLVIVPATPGSARAGQLRSPGWSVASDWYLGRPRVAAA